jgi:hypothetical protein
MPGAEGPCYPLLASADERPRRCSSLETAAPR